MSQAKAGGAAHNAMIRTESNSDPEEEPEPPKPTTGPASRVAGTQPKEKQ